MIAVEAIQRNSTYFTARMQQAVLEIICGQPPPAGEGNAHAAGTSSYATSGGGEKHKGCRRDSQPERETAETHRSNVMSKLGLHSVSELVLYAVRNNIVQAFSSTSAPLLTPSRAALSKRRKLTQLTRTNHKFSCAYISNLTRFTDVDLDHIASHPCCRTQRPSATDTENTVYANGFYSRLPLAIIQGRPATALLASE